MSVFDGWYLVDKKQLTLWQRIRILLTGRYYAFSIDCGAHEPHPFYYSHCHKHGYFVAPVQGYDNTLDCPKCFGEMSS